MADVSERLGIHTSTVSRAVNGKYLQSPRGVILMKELFSAAIKKASEAAPGEEMLGAAQIKEKIKELVLQEDKAKPYSDQTLSKMLLDEGIRISRRAVAKYREELGIRGSFERKL